MLIICPDKVASFPDAVNMPGRRFNCSDRCERGSAQEQLLAQYIFGQKAFKPAIEYQQEDVNLAAVLARS
jgi:hypothetical protein